MTKKNIDLHENVMDIETLYQRWIKKSGSCQISDPDVIDALEQMKGKEDEIEEAFYRDLAFGTGGIRGIIGAGPNRMNIHTVARVTILLKSIKAVARMRQNYMDAGLR